MIKSFNCKETVRIWKGNSSRKLPSNIQHRALVKLRMLDSALCIEDLRNPPSNHLEKLRGEKVEYLSIRINDQWRVVFKWLGNNAYDVVICDYH